MGRMVQVRHIRGVLLAALVLLAGLTPAARAQSDQPPLEDVVLQGRVLRPDGSPLANVPLRVDARKATSGFAIFSFFFTAGLSTISCFDPSSDVCILPNTKTFSSTTDANGHYSFTFPKAKRHGEQTNTDYFLSVAMPSRNGKNAIVIAQYELELLTQVHNAPDVVMWDPKAAIKAGTRDYELVYAPRAQSKNGLQVFVGDDQTNLSASSKNARTLEARDIEDTTLNLVPYSSKDETAEGTIYHQRFTASPVPLRGALVALSRRAACTVVRKDGTRSGACGYTDGDVAHPAVTDPNPCQYDMDGKPYITEDVMTGERTPCQAPVTEVTLDLRSAKQVGEVRARGCGACAVRVSEDGAAWDDVPVGRTFASRPVRYARVSGQGLSYVNEISMWPPWPDEVAKTPLAPEDPTPTTPLRTSDDQALPKPGGTPNDGGIPWRLVLVAFVVLGVVAQQAWKRLRT